MDPDSPVKQKPGDPPLKVLHLIATNFLGGPEKQILEHLKRLNSHRFRGVLSSFQEWGEPNELLEKAGHQGLTHYSIPMYGPFDVRAQFHLNRIIRREGIDLLVAHHYKSCIMGWWAGRKFRIPVLAYSRGYTAESRKMAFYYWLERQFLKRVSGIVAVSVGQTERLKEYGIHPANFWVVHNAISVKNRGNENSFEKRGNFLSTLHIPPHGKIIVTAGRLSPEKGHRFLVEAIPGVLRERKDPFFVFCGDGPMSEKIVRLAKELGVFDQCRFLGFCHDLAGIFSAMDFLVLPSLSEGLPNVVLEAFAASKPVVASNVGGVPEVVEEGVSGYLVPPARPEPLARAILRMLSDPGKIESMGAAGYERVRREFTFESQTEKLESIYSQVINWHKAGRD
ncbi:MAG: glycosyltransferase, partial [Syntrophaceae bacterium]|nr:glycosyltransferase [Syntrophaceae bacterium]